MGSMIKVKAAMVLAAISVLVSGCAEPKSAPAIQGVSAQDPFYMIQGWHYEQDGSSSTPLTNSRSSGGLSALPTLTVFAVGIRRPNTGNRLAVCGTTFAADHRRRPHSGSSFAPPAKLLLQSER